MISQLQKIHQKSTRLIIGLMSGTSLDGVDAALIQMTKDHVSLIDFLFVEYTSRERDQILRCIENGTAALISETNFMLGQKFAETACQLMKKNGLQRGKVDLIGSHGQTIWHEHQQHTLQIGEAAVIAEVTGAMVVSDFRVRDVAAGGAGAPLVPYVDDFLFRSETKARILQNIGGIANCTVLTPPHSTREHEGLLAFDTGPGVMIIDALVKRFTHSQLQYDHDGEIARSGQVIDTLLQKWLAMPYFHQPPPKSCGREQFGKVFVDRILASYPLTPDLITTATILTAQSIIDAYRRFVFPQTKIDEIIVSGGGSRNPVLMTYLRDHLPEIMVYTSDDFGIPSDAKEAIAFAVLANQTILGIPTNVPAVTGAKQNVILGKITAGLFSK